MPNYTMGLKLSFELIVKSTKEDLMIRLWLNLFSGYYIYSHQIWDAIYGQYFYAIVLQRTVIQ